MTNNDIQMMMQSGITAISSQVLELNAAYQVTKFKAQVDKIFKAWQERFDALPKEAGIEDGQAFDRQRKELTEKIQKEPLSNAETKALTALNEKMDRLQGLRAELGKEQVKFDCKPISYEDWRALKTANKDLKIGNAEMLEVLEVTLGGILWTAPTEEEMAPAEQK